MPTEVRAGKVKVVRAGAIKVITALIKAGARKDMNAKSPNRGRTPLHLTIVGGKEATAKVMVMTGAGVNNYDRDAMKDAALHLAIERGHDGVAKDMLLRGADTSVKGLKGNYLLHLAASRGQDEVLLALVHREADLYCRDSSRWTPLAGTVSEIVFPRWMFSGLLQGQHQT